MPTDIAFWIAIPGAFIVLFFAWLMYIGRGRRATKFTLSGMGISVSIDSQEVHAQQKELDPTKE